MLISIAIENFKSFEKQIVFNMIASNKLRNDDEKKFNINGASILKSALIYGANASGKSNLIDAFRFMRQSVLSSKGIPLRGKNLFSKNRRENEDKITTFEIRLCKNNRCYAYGFDVILKESRITSEWILELKESQAPCILFKRENDSFELNERLSFNDTDATKFNTYADDMSDKYSILFLSEMNRNKKISDDSSLSFFKDIYSWFDEDLNIYAPDIPVANFEYYYDETSLEEVNHLIQTFDTGITSIMIKKLSLDELQNKLHREIYEDILEKIEEKKQKNADSMQLSLRSKNEFFNILVENDNEPEITTLCFRHGNSFYEFEFNEESDGTRRIFDLLDIILSKNKNGVYIIDELERSLHPMLTKRFIELLNECHKKNNIQVIFTTHESTIMTLELFRKDQIWFMNKEADYNTSLYPLDVFKERNDKVISKAYLEGRYGAIPLFKHFEMEEID